ncbi:Hint domain-containing protein [Roseovarius sp.]|uniref:Hint domain-containing protein n=1 Tax=Roseovarius sp. TaxID=1486281 RepID=UPI003A986540
MVADVEIPIDRNASAVEMAETIFDDGVQVIGASYTGDRNSSGIYSNGEAISPGIVPSDTGVMLSTGDLRGVTNSNIFQSNQNASTTTSSSGPNGVADFNAAAGAKTFDASYLDVDFIPTGDVMTMQFVFTSEEYPEFSAAAFQDFFGVWINGSLVPLSVSDGDIDLNNLNAGSNGNLFINNSQDQFNTEIDGFTVTMTLTITQINGKDVVAGDIVILNSGEQNQLNADGTIKVIGNGDSEVFNFTYEEQSSTGQTDVGFVTVNSVPCFVAGTLIRTSVGEETVESLQPSDLVITQDEGPQPLRWIGRRRVAAMGAFAPIHIAAGTFGRHRELLLSPLHRVLICDSLAELLFGEHEVLVAARELANDRSVRHLEGGMVDYVHILFDRHQLVFSEGLTTEIFLPGPQTAQNFEAEIAAEICALFPEFDPETGAGYSPAKRNTLKSHEARLLAAQGLAA